MRRSSPRLALFLAVLAGLGALTGCGRAPSFNILGSFFPAWLICMVVGILLAAIVSWVLSALRLEKLISWGILVYPCLAAFFAFTLWLVFFR
jgi:YtcA family